MTDSTSTVPFSGTGTTPTSKPAAPEGAPCNRPVSFAIVFAVGFCGVCAFLDTYATQPLLPLFVRLFHASKAAAGLTVSATTFGVAISAALIGTLAEKYSRKRVIVFSALALSLPTLLTATSSSLHAIVFWRLLQGLIMPGIFAIAIAYITEEFPPNRIAFVMSVYVSGTALGGFIGRLTSGLVAEYYGWHWSFVALSGLSLLGAASIARWLPAERRRTPHSKQPPVLTQILQMRQLFSNRRLVATCALGFNVLFSLVAIFTYITFYLAGPPFHLSTAALSYLFTVYLIGLVITPAAGYVISRIGMLRGIVGAVSTSMAGVLLTLIPSVWAVIAGLALVCTGVFISQSTASSYLRVAAPPHARASAAGLYISCYYLGGTVAGVLPSVFWAMGKWPACVAFIVGMQCISLTLALLNWRS